MKVLVMGTRGIPNIQGGVETHCQELYPRLVALGCNVTLLTRRSYIKDQGKSFRGVNLKHLYAPRSKSLEAIVHSFVCVLYAFLSRPDLVHVHAIGPSLMVPFARLLRLRVVVTNHGPDYDRQKWGGIASLVLRAGEMFGAKFANRVIVISSTIKSLMERKYSVENSALIPNGVNMPKLGGDTSFLDNLGVKPSKYILAVGRFVEEKGFHDLIDAFQMAGFPEYKLVLVGGADHDTQYSLALKNKCIRAGVITTGFIQGEDLAQIYKNARLFVLPSYHEGLPIVLLEAMSFGLEILASNIPANQEVELGQDRYFEVGNTTSLTSAMLRLLEIKIKPDYTKVLKDKYNWDSVAEKTQLVYKSVLD